MMYEKISGGEEEWRVHLVQAVQAGMEKEELFTFTNILKKEQPETASYRNRKLTESNIEEWKADGRSKRNRSNRSGSQILFKTMGR